MRRLAAGAGVEPIWSIAIGRTRRCTVQLPIDGASPRMRMADRSRARLRQAL
jgi:hypothetical protein